MNYKYACFEGSKMKNIVHIIYHDKFTDGYINFMNNYLSEYNHLFYTTDRGFDLKVTSDDKVIFLNSYNDLNNKANKSTLKSADIIIISGFFFVNQMKVFFNKKILNKTYFHLWGADFYCLAKNGSIKRIISNFLRKYFLSNAAGVINLIPGDYEILCKYCTPKGKHFVAPMCDDGTTQKIVNELKNVKKETNPYKIMVGNSATETNQHFEILHLLERFRDENIEIICPLSYGDKKYAELVIEEGNRIFENKFKPLLEYMDKKDYFKMIATSGVAIFNNNRQQAMGNINATLGLGCKVYIRSDTPMWKTFHSDRQYCIYRVEDIESMSFDEFIKISSDVKKNVDIYSDLNDVNKYVNQWVNVLESI